jgi:hypothetical protein
MAAGDALTTDQILRMREAVDTTLADTITIMRESRTYDGGGGYNTEYLVYEEDVPASVGLPLGGETDTRAASGIRLADEDLYTIRLPAKTDVIKTDRIIWADAEVNQERTFEVTDVPRRGAYELTGRIRVKEM